MIIISKEAGTVVAVPGLKVACLVSKALPYYSETGISSNTELAACVIAERFQLSLDHARTVAELAGYGRHS